MERVLLYFKPDCQQPGPIFLAEIFPEFFTSGPAQIQMGPQTSREAPPIECRVDNVHAFEQYMHDCGLYGIEDMRPVNELRMKARWKLGAALAKVTRALGNNQYASRSET
jgi:hypothetical protein